MSEVKEALLKRYSHLHLLLLHRSVEKARSDTELFDILDGIDGYPVLWDETDRRWAKTDLVQTNMIWEEK